MTALTIRKLSALALAAILLLTVPSFAASSLLVSSTPPLLAAGAHAEPSMLQPIPAVVSRASHASAPLLSSQILETHAASLITYKVAASPIQGVQPRADQRGVGLDGSLRAGPSFPMHLAGNPFGSPW